MPCKGVNRRTLHWFEGGADRSVVGDQFGVAQSPANCSHRAKVPLALTVSNRRGVGIGK